MNYKAYSNNMKFQPLRKLEARTSPDALVKARKLYEQDSLNIKLKTLREKYGIKQDNVDNFTQTAVSKLERRKGRDTLPA